MNRKSDDLGIWKIANTKLPQLSIMLDDDLCPADQMSNLLPELSSG